MLETNSESQCKLSIFKMFCRGVCGTEWEQVREHLQGQEPRVVAVGTGWDQSKGEGPASN